MSNATNFIQIKNKFQNYSVVYKNVEAVTKSSVASDFATRQ